MGEYQLTAVAKDQVTRIVVAHQDGPGGAEYFADQWSVILEDDGRTLRLVGSGDGEAAICRDPAVAEALERFRAKK